MVNINFIMRHAIHTRAYSRMGCDKSPILRRSEANGHSSGGALPLFSNPPPIPSVGVCRGSTFCEVLAPDNRMISRACLTGPAHGSDCRAYFPGTLRRTPDVKAQVPEFTRGSSGQKDKTFGYVRGSSGQIGGFHGRFGILCGRPLDPSPEKPTYTRSSCPNPTNTSAPRN